jgi:HD-GYP domain-containing protein (c-di-GMP phosphodiesterase class II)
MDAACYAGLLRYIGCVATAHDTAPFASGDEVAFLAAFQDADFARRAATMRTAFARMLTADAPLARRVGGVAAFLAWPAGMQEIPRAHCELAVTVVSELALPDATRRALAQLYERVDGRGEPHALDAPDPVARVLHVAQVFEVYTRLYGPEVAWVELQRRSGAHLDGKLVGAALALGRSLIEGLDAPWETFLTVAPRDQTARLDHVAEVLGDVADAKCTFTAGHSRRVARLTADAAALVGLDPSEPYLAGLLHDVGRIAVPNGIWDAARPWTVLERETASAHARHTDRILAGAPALAGAREIAANAHERLDGSGYPRRLGASALDLASRLLAAADTWVAAQEPRPHRPALDAPGATAVLEQGAVDGRYDRVAVRAVVAAAGERPPAARDARPFGLTDREVDVLRAISLGQTAKQIATSLGLSTRTVENHTRAVFAKLGVSTRAAAGVFAARAGVV